MSLSLKEALKILNLASPLSIRELKIAFRQETMKFSPEICHDKYCDVNLQKVNQAYQILLAYAEHHPIEIDEKLFAPESYAEWWAEHFGAELN